MNTEQQPQQVEAILPRTKIEMTSQSMNAYANTSRRIKAAPKDKLTLLEWITYFDSVFFKAAIEGKTEIEESFSWSAGPTPETAQAIARHYERQGFQFKVYETDKVVKSVWVEW